MIKTTLSSVALLAALSLANTTMAQNSHNMSMHEQMQQHKAMQEQHQFMRHPGFNPPAVPNRPAFSEFPTPDELARMTPPEPMTAEKIKKHFAKHKARIEETIARDRKQAEKYAKDFSRYQKHQADQLAKIMAKAEKQREAMLNRLGKREQRALENFQKRNTARQTEPKQY